MKEVPGNCGLAKFEDSSVLVDSGGPGAAPGLGLAEGPWPRGLGVCRSSGAVTPLLWGVRSQVSEDWPSAPSRGDRGGLCPGAVAPVGSWAL